MPAAKVMYKSRGGLRYAHPAIFDFVKRLENAYVVNLTPAHVEYYGRKVIARVISLVRENEAHFYEPLDASVQAALDERHRIPFPRPAFELLLEKYAKLRTKDFALNLNRRHDEHRRTDATAEAGALRPGLRAISAATASAASKCK